MLASIADIKVFHEVSNSGVYSRIILENEYYRMIFKHSPKRNSLDWITIDVRANFRMIYPPLRHILSAPHVQNIFVRLSLKRKGFVTCLSQALIFDARLTHYGISQHILSGIIYNIPNNFFQQLVCGRILFTRIFYQLSIFLIKKGKYPVQRYMWYVYFYMLALIWTE